MRVMHVSWEYPPVMHGGLGRHVHGLATAQAAAGDAPHVLTQLPDRVRASAPGTATPGTPDSPGIRPVRAEVVSEEVEGVLVTRTLPDPPAVSMEEHLVEWSLLLGHAMTRVALAGHGGPRPDLVHAHDWLAAHAAVTIARTLHVPLVATIHATEAGLWGGWITRPVSRSRHEVECWLVRQASRVIVCSGSMRDEVSRGLSLPGEDLDLVPNGVDLDRWRSDEPARRAIRARLGIPQDAPLLLQPGRIEWEKGSHIAVEAMQSVLKHHPGAVLVVAGDGSRRAELQATVRRFGLGASVVLPGRISEADLPALLGAADVVLVPSLYEPFGLVALEAQAAGAPVVASDTGGLRDSVRDGVTGLSVPPGDADRLADAVLALLADGDLRKRLAAEALAQATTRFTWPVVAAATAEVYGAARNRPVPLRPAAPAFRYGNVFTGEPLVDSE